MKNLSLIFLLFISIKVSISQNVGINTTGAAPASTNLLEVLSPSTTANSVAVFASHTGAITGTGYAIRASKTGASTTNIAGEFAASGATSNTAATFTTSGAHTTNTAASFASTGATNNYAIIVPASSGNVGIGTSTPTATNLLQVTSTSTTASSVAINASHSGAITGTGYAMRLSKTGASTTNVGGEFAATGATNNYAIVVPASSGSVGIGTSTPDSKAILDISSTTQGVLFPRMTTVQRDAISSPTAGLMIINTTTNCFEIYNGSVWLSSCSGFSNTGGTTCSVVAGTASATPTTGTCGTPTLLKLTGATASTFQWQRSSNNSVFADISGATTAYYSLPTINSATSASASQYFRCRVSDGTCTVYSNTLTLTNTCASDSWCQKMDAPATGTSRYGTFSFSIGTKGYMGGGINSATLRSDVWQYDPALDIWTQLADFAGTACMHSSAFAIGTKGYVAGGQNSSGATMYSHLYEFDPSLNSWTVKASMPVAKSLGAGMSDGTNGYFAGGITSGGTVGTAAVYKYNVAGDSWSTVTSLPVARVAPVGFNIGTNIYVATGGDALIGPAYLTSVYKSTDGGTTWSPMTAIPVARMGAFVFTNSTKAYIGGGIGLGPTSLTSLYEYDQAGNSWTVKTSCATSLSYAASFSLNNLGYVGIGTATGGYNSLDVFQYFP